MSADSREPSPPDTPGGRSRSPADGAPDRTVVTVGALAVLAVVAWAALAKDSFDTASGTALAWVLENFAWLFVIAADVFLVLCVVLAISRFGRIRLGADDSAPAPPSWSRCPSSLSCCCCAGPC
ncbi:BCCT family transporter [Streptomyces sp. NPDC058646]|uniref:BCCT family transporter n=1 Tax=Streptomyces sp. NPDC058646 TaxID=3346574 RepID=UPI00364DEC5F